MYGTAKGPSIMWAAAALAVALGVVLVGPAMRQALLVAMAGAIASGVSRRFVVVALWRRGWTAGEAADAGVALLLLGGVTTITVMIMAVMV